MVVLLPFLGAQTASRSSYKLFREFILIVAELTLSRLYVVSTSSGSPDAEGPEGNVKGQHLVQNCTKRTTILYFLWNAEACTHFIVNMTRDISCSRFLLLASRIKEHCILHSACQNLSGITCSHLHMWRHWHKLAQARGWRPMGAAVSL